MPHTSSCPICNTDHDISSLAPGTELTCDNCGEPLVVEDTESRPEGPAGADWTIVKGVGGIFLLLLRQEWACC
jgi:hypothetical protein